MTAPWRIFVDTGGTFTDCLAIAPDGSTRRLKVLSSAVLRGRIEERVDDRSLRVDLGGAVADDVPRGMSCGAALVRSWSRARRLLRFDRPLPIEAATGAALELASTLEPPLLAAHLATATPCDAPLPAIDMRLATTRGTNALLERRGARTALLVTRGFADLLRIGDQRRPELFARAIVRPTPLAEIVIEVDARRDAEGGILHPLEEAEIARVVAAVRDQGAEAAAVALLHAWRDPSDERRLAAALRAAGVRHASCSCDAAPGPGILARATTATVDAFLGPALDDYLARISSALAGGRLRVMTSAGGLVAAASFRPREGLLSGPAGGALGAMAIAARSGFARAIGLDMGGTSTDVVRLEGAPSLRGSHRVGDVELATPALDIVTVAAGGGSVVDVENGLLAVGPRSAGAAPGPACYGRGGPLTLTDVDLLLGRLDGRRLGIPIDEAAAQSAAAALLAAAAGAGRPFATLEALLDAAVAIADARVAEAIAAVSQRRGIDPSDHALVAFGGAGGLHACAVAERLGIAVVLLPPAAGVLSALGLAVAPVERAAAASVLACLPEGAPELGRALRSARDAARAALRAEEGVATASARLVVSARLLGQTATIEVDLREPELDLEPGELAAEVAARFARDYHTLHGHAPPERPIEIAAVRVTAAAAPDAALELLAVEAHSSAPSGHRRVRDGERWLDAAVLEQESLRAGALHEGPLLLLAAHSSAWIPTEWRVAVDAAGTAIVRRTATAVDAAAAALRGAGESELVAGRLVAAATEMGELLERTAISVNVKERLDFSCGVLDASGRLVANAPHVPVHLGALGPCVRAVRAACAPGPGDVIVTNHPACGGSHLPDVTLVAPVHERLDGGALLGWVAARAHHAELGGSRPGSMPPFATTLLEEAVVLAPRHLVRAGAPLWDEVEQLLRAPPWPSRAVAENLADLAAALAATALGARRLRELAAALGPTRLATHLEAVRGRAARRAAAVLRALPIGRREAIDRLDDGTPIAVAIDIEHDGDGGRMRIDLTGTGGVHPTNLNATEAIVRSAVLYSLRLLVDEPLPLNEGLLEPVQLHVPSGLLAPWFRDDPALCPAVGAGNTETSQRLVDALLGALGIMAASQGTMNNVLFGIDSGPRAFGYYETVGGGAGAGPGFRGADAVHVHMTNTRITDAEILEHRFPVRLERFAIRTGSGGAGLRRGGDGIERVYAFLAPMSVSLLTQRRTSGPPGLDGGRAGEPGRQWIERADGTLEPLGSSAVAEVRAGDRLVLLTPGGGGWGDPDRGVAG